MFRTTANEYGLTEGREITEEELSRIAAEGEEHNAFTAAIDSLSRSSRSQKEIRMMLKTKGFPPEAVESAVTKLLGYGYLGDEEFAASFVSAKGEKYGRRKLIYELTWIRGIDGKIAEKAVYDVWDDDSETEKGVRLGGLYLERARRRRTDLRGKTYGFLAVRGFDPEIISAVMDRLDFSPDDDPDDSL